MARDKKTGRKDTSREPPGDRRTVRRQLSWGALVLLATTFLLKLLVLLALKDHPLTQPDAGLDTTAYADLARQVLAGNIGLGPGLYYVSPLYIYVLAGLLAVFDSFTAVRLAQILLGTASVWFIFLAARRWFGGRAGWLAAAAAALTGLFTFYEVLILQASIDAVLTAAALYVLASGLASVPDSPRPRGALQDTSRLGWKSLVAGVIFGIQTLNRPNVLVAAVGVAVALIATRRGRPAVLLLAGLLAGMAPVAIRNVVVAHQWSLVSSHGGLNFYIGNNERASGFYTTVPGITPTIVGQEKDARRLAERALGRPVTDAETSSYFFRLARAWMVAHPVAAIGLFARKLYYVFNAQHIALPHSYPFYAYDTATPLRFYAVGPWLLIPLGLAGLMCAPARGRTADYFVWVAFVPAYAVSVALFFVAERYRLPLLVPLCIGTGAAIDMALSAVEAGRVLALARPAAVLGALLVAANWPLHLNAGRWDEGLRMAERLVILQRYDEADTWTARLEATGAPRAGAAHYGVGAQLLLEGQIDRALVHLAAAHDADPEDPRVDYTLGQALLKAGRAADAIPHLRRGFDAGIEIPGGGFDLAVALHAAGDLPGAVAVVRRVRLAESADVEAWLRLGRIAQEGRDPRLAETYFRHAVDIRPDLAGARQQFGLNLLVLGQLPDAERELLQAVRLEPRNSDSLAALAFCEMRMGRAKDARAHAAAALAINPDDPLAKGILRGGGS